jgi:hypothetical protein
MATESLMRRWSAWPSRVALLLGLGALSVPEAPADVRETSRDDAASLGGAVIRSDGGRIYLFENGRETELPLSATPEREHLLRLLDEHGPAGIRLDPDPRLIMSGGGGTGFSLWDIKKSLTDKPPPAPPDPPQATTPSRSTKRQPASRDRNQSTGGKD